MHLLKFSHKSYCEADTLAQHAGNPFNFGWQVFFIDFPIPDFLLGKARELSNVPFCLLAILKNWD